MLPNEDEERQFSCKLQVWDTAGRPMFRSITTSYVRGAHSVVIVYDITHRESFNEASTHIMIAKNNPSLHTNASMFLVGNKLDLAKADT